MARRSSKSTAPTKPLLKTPVRIGRLDTAAIVGGLRRLHEDAEDPDVDRMPADEELYGALLYLEAHADALKTTEAQREAAINRVRLWEYLREQTDSHQAKAIEEARAVNTEWRELAPALAVNSPSAAYNKATRLRAAALSNVSPDDQAVRRTPEAVLEAERQAALRAAAERRAQEEAARLHGLLAPIAKRLIGHRDGLDDDSDVTFWLDQINALLPSCHTPTQLLSLETYVKAVVRELRRVERTTARSAASTTDAQLAYAAAVELVL